MENNFKNNMCICITESHTQKRTLVNFMKFSNVYLFASFSKCPMDS